MLTFNIKKILPCTKHTKLYLHVHVYKWNDTSSIFFHFTISKIFSCFHYLTVQVKHCQIFYNFELTCNCPCKLSVTFCIFNTSSTGSTIQTSGRSRREDYVGWTPSPFRKKINDFMQTFCGECNSLL